MAKFSYEDYENKKAAAETKSDFKVSFFSLKDDGDEAIVRFNYHTVQDFEVVTVHTITTVTKEKKEIYKKVSCLRTGKDPIEKCPLCAANNPLAAKFFVKLITYIKNDAGQIIPKAAVWERPVKFIEVLKPYLDEYGDLTDIIFKVKRQGVRGSKETTYAVMPVRADIYPANIYVKDFSDFDGYKLAGSSYLSKTAEEMSAYLTTGEFPKVEAAKAEQSQEVTKSKVEGYAETFESTRHTGVTSAPLADATPAPATSTPMSAPAPKAEEKSSTTSNPADDRPRRYTW